ncbi:hypothetical protein ACFQFH_11210 [Halobaculum halobium]|uniref:VanZ like family protein n=1 Tax=Halobaculum halobium TaxID=3032281 RepID=A0ABD5TAH4_9EURY|nr:hypothetical protein [Halobaculum sp. SYNS20]
MDTDARRLVIFAAVTVLVVTSSLVPGPTDATGEPTPDVAPPGTDLLAHFVGYAAIAYTLGRALSPRRSRGDGEPSASVAAVVGVVAVATGIGAGVEVAQGVVPGRDPSALDGVANAVGAAVGALLWRRRGGERDAGERGGDDRE